MVTGTAHIPPWRSRKKSSAPSRAPERLLAAAHRDRESARSRRWGRAGRTPPAARFLRHVGQPPAVGRKHHAVVVERRLAAAGAARCRRPVPDHAAGAGSRHRHPPSGGACSARAGRRRSRPPRMSPGTPPGRCRCRRRAGSSRPRGCRGVARKPTLRPSGVQTGRSALPVASKGRRLKDPVASCLTQICCVPRRSAKPRSANRRRQRHRVERAVHGGVHRRHAGRRALTHSRPSSPDGPSGRRGCRSRRPRTAPCRWRFLLQVLEHDRGRPEELRRGGRRTGRRAAGPPRRRSARKPGATYRAYEAAVRSVTAPRREVHHAERLAPMPALPEHDQGVPAAGQHVGIVVLLDARGGVRMRDERDGAAGCRHPGKAPIVMGEVDLAVVAPVRHRRTAATESCTSVRAVPPATEIDLQASPWSRSR